MFTVNALLSVELWPPGLVTVTECAPVGALAEILIPAVRSVEELNVHELTVIPEPKAHVAPVRKLLPLRFTDAVVPWYPEVGLTELNVGGGGGGAWLMVKPVAKVAVCRSGFVTLTPVAPRVAAGGMVILAVSWVAELKVHEFTVMPDPKAQ